MIPDKRLEEIQSCLVEFLAVAGLRKNPKVTDDELWRMATELLSLRKQKRRLVDQCRRLYDELFGWIGSEGIKSSQPGSVELLNCDALLKELEAK